MMLLVCFGNDRLRFLVHVPVRCRRLDSWKQSDWVPGNEHRDGGSSRIWMLRIVSTRCHLLKDVWFMFVCVVG
jgi:hypothetical protein